MGWRVVGTVLVLLYPLAVYLALTRYDGRLSMLGLLTVAVMFGVLRWSQAESGARLNALAAPAMLACLAGVSLLLDDHRFVLALPVLINAGLLVTFASSLSTDMPLVERFARMQIDDLSPAELRYCRTVTVVWSAFFVLNGLAAGLLALLAPTAWWALYTGLIAYLLIGALGAGEYIVRKLRFGRYGTGLHDRLLSNLLPAPSVERGEVPK